MTSMTASKLSVMDDADAVMLVIVKQADEPLFIKHYEFEQKTASLHIVTVSG
jgi:hypothetical protein